MILVLFAGPTLIVLTLGGFGVLDFLGICLLIPLLIWPFQALTLLFIVSRDIFILVQTLKRLKFV